MYCDNCGNKISSKDLFCGKCGEQLKDFKEKKDVTDNKVGKFLKSKKGKTSLIFLSIIIVGLIVGSAIISNIYNYPKVIENVVKALEEKDGKSLSEAIHTENKDINIDENTVKPIIDYYDGNIEEISYLGNDLLAEGEHIKDLVYPEYNTMKDYNYNEIFEIKKSKLLWMDIFKIYPREVRMKFSSNLDHVSIKYDKQEIASITKKDEGVVAPILPGFYEFTADYNMDNLSMSTTQEALVYRGYGEEIDMYFDVEYFQVPQEYSSFDVYVNGEKTDKKVSDYKDNTVGPLNESRRLSLSKAYPFGDMKSIEISDSYNEIEFVLDKGNREIIKNNIIGFLKSCMDYVSDNSKDKISNVTRNYENNLKEWVSTNKDTNNKNYLYKGTLQSIDFDKGEIVINKDEDAFYVEINLRENYNDAFYAKGEEAELEENSVERTYKVVYDKAKNQWLLDDKSDTFYLEEEELETIEINYTIQ